MGRGVGHRPSRNWRPAASWWCASWSGTACGTPGVPAACKFDHHRLGLLSPQQSPAELHGLLHASHVRLSVSASLPWAALSSRCVMRDVLLRDDWAAFLQSCSDMPSCLHSAQLLHHRGPDDARDAAVAPAHAQHIHDTSTAHPFNSDRRLARECKRTGGWQVRASMACRHALCNMQPAPTRSLLCVPSCCSSLPLQVHDGTLPA